MALEISSLLISLFTFLTKIEQYKRQNFGQFPTEIRDMKNPGIDLVDPAIQESNKIF
jgi:hypothetical protein